MLDPKEVCALNIPKRTNGAVNRNIIAVIHTMTNERVKGSIHYGYSDVSWPFDVKHNGKMFTVGSGSGKKRFYFGDWNKGVK